MKHQRKDLNFYRDLLATAEYRSLTIHEKGVELFEVHELKAVEIEELIGLKKDALRRAVKASQKQRDLGFHGRPRLLNEHSIQKISDKIRDGMRQGEDMDFTVCKMIVSHEIMKIQIPSLTIICKVQ